MERGQHHPTAAGRTIGTRLPRWRWGQSSSEAPYDAAAAVLCLLPEALPMCCCCCSQPQLGGGAMAAPPAAAAAAGCHYQAGRAWRCPELCLVEILLLYGVETLCYRLAATAGELGTAPRLLPSWAAQCDMHVSQSASRGRCSCSSRWAASAGCDRVRRWQERSFQSIGMV